MSEIKKCKCDGHWHKDAMVENNDTYLCVVCASKEITRLQAENDSLKSLMKEAYENCPVCRYENFILSRRCARCQAFAKYIELEEVRDE